MTRATNNEDCRYVVYEGSGAVVIFSYSQPTIPPSIEGHGSRADNYWKALALASKLSKQSGMPILRWHYGDAL